MRYQLSVQFEFELHGKLVAHLRLQSEHSRDTFFSSAADLFGELKAGSAAATVTVESEVARVASIADLGARPPSQACPRPAVKFALTNATSAFDDFSQSRYHNVWRISFL